MKKTIKQQTSVSPENQKKTLELFFRYFETKKLLLWPTLMHHLDLYHLNACSRCLMDS